ncbi:MAG: putative integral rane protein [Candidatus Saccharibacteria bacterium]|nr:putative integral rane protein [Candidatus Saccharibacteria bacterium]
MHNLLDPTYLIKATGYIGIFSIVLLESGFIFGFFLPGDSLLFTAGLLASQGYLNIGTLIVISIIGAIIGNSVGFYTGSKLGPRLFKRDKSVVFSPRRVEEAHEFFDTQGPKSLILARFIPAVRTFVPIIAGVAGMKYRTFIIFNAIGGTLWGALLPLLGYTLGRAIPSIDKYLLPIIFLIIVISALPVVIQYLKARKKK